MAHPPQAAAKSLADAVRDSLSRKSKTATDRYQPDHGTLPPKREPDPNGGLRLQQAQPQFRLLKRIAMNMRRPRVDRLLPDFKTPRPGVGFEAFRFAKRFNLAEGLSSPAAHEKAKNAITATGKVRTRYPNCKRRTCFRKNMFYRMTNELVLAAQEYDKQVAKAGPSNTSNVPAVEEQGNGGVVQDVEEVTAAGENNDNDNQQATGPTSFNVTLKFGQRTLVTWTAIYDDQMDDSQQREVTPSSGEPVQYGEDMLVDTPANGASTSKRRLTDGDSSAEDDQPRRKKRRTGRTSRSL
ncbi:hypothetical protein C8Q75DRAFT_737534 [Abortiporus biennis]|nr:hypothetical protein C8Q75DRAFT_737534 [Abortiporus biennis]